MYSLTLILVIITVLTSMLAWNNQDFMDNCTMKPWMVKHKSQYYRFISSGFVHLNWLHLAFNMLTFYFMGKTLEINFHYYLPHGTQYFLFLYISAIIVSDLPTYFRYKDHSWYTGLGASGGVSAIVFASIILSPAGSRLLVMGIPMSPIIFGVIYLAYSWYAARNVRDGVNHDAHFWGASYGIIFTLIFVPDSLQIFSHQLQHLLN